MNTIFFAVMQNLEGKKIDAIELVEGVQEVKELYNWALDTRESLDKVSGPYIILDLKAIVDRPISRTTLNQLSKPSY